MSSKHQRQPKIKGNSLLIEVEYVACPDFAERLSGAIALLLGAQEDVASGQQGPQATERAELNKKIREE